MEQQLYHLTLLLSGITCIVMAAALSYNNFYYRDYRIYKRSRLLTALTLTTFGIGFLLHLYFGWRTCWPSAATALSVTYFHIGGTMLSWSHTSLLNPEYLNRFRVIRDMTALVVNIVTLWTDVFFDISFLTGIGIGIFLTHVTWMSTDFLRTYLRAIADYQGERPLVDYRSATFHILRATLHVHLLLPHHPFRIRKHHHDSPAAPCRMAILRIALCGKCRILLYLLQPRQIWRHHRSSHQCYRRHPPKNATKNWSMISSQGKRCFVLFSFI